MKAMYLEFRLLYDMCALTVKPPYMGFITSHFEYNNNMIRQSRNTLFRKFPGIGISGITMSRHWLKKTT